MIFIIIIRKNINQTLLDNIRKQVKASGLWAPQMPIERSGLGLGPIGMAVLYEEMNRSIFGPVCFNCAAPDDGNMYILNKIASAEQKVKWLDPIINGDVRSALAMTEPAPGGGSDPSMIKTEAVYTNNKWIVNGLKWYITGAGVASHFILLAKTKGGLTAFLYHKDQPGWSIKRRIPIMGPEEHGGHCEIEYNGLEIPDENRLGEVGEGFIQSMKILDGGRISIGALSLGVAKGAYQAALHYSKERKQFGQPISSFQGISFKLAEMATEIEASELLLHKAAFDKIQGKNITKIGAMAKMYASEVCVKVANEAVQIHGGYGFTKDYPVEKFYRDAKLCTIGEGTTEIQKLVISRELLRD